MIKSKITLLLPTYNRLFFLKKTLPKIIKSAVNNSCNLLILDNASTDGTYKYLKKIESKYKFIKFIRHKKNIGGVQNYKFGLKIINTKYIMFLSDDDLIYGDYINKVISILDNNININIVHHYFFNHKRKFDFFTQGSIAKKKIFLLSSSITGLSFRNEKNLQHKFLTRNHKIYPQIDMCMYLANKGDVALLNNSGFLNLGYQTPEYNFIRQERPNDFGLQERLTIAKKNFNLFMLLDVCKALFAWHIQVLNEITDRKIKQNYVREILKIFNIYSFHNSLLINLKSFNFKNFISSILYLLYFKTWLCLIINTILFIKNFFIDTIFFLRKRKNND